MEPNACFMFYLVMKMRENLYNKPYRTRQTSVKPLKNIKMNIQKETNITWIHMDFFIFIYSLLAVMVTVTAF